MGKRLLDGGAKFFILFGLFFALAAINTLYYWRICVYVYVTPFMGDFVRGGDKVPPIILETFCRTYVEK